MFRTVTTVHGEVYEFPLKEECHRREDFELGPMDWGKESQLAYSIRKLEDEQRKLKDSQRPEDRAIRNTET